MATVRKKWKSDGPFCRWLIKSGYARYSNSSLALCVSGGLVIYMWEAYLSGVKQGEANTSDARKRREP